MPRRHRRPADAPRDRAEEVAVGRQRPGRRRAELEGADREVARPGEEEGGGEPVAVALRPVTADAVLCVFLLATSDQVGARRNAHHGQRHVLRLEDLPPRPAIRPELLDVADERDQLLRRDHQQDGGEGGRRVGERRQVEDGRAVDRELAVGVRAYEREPRLVGEEEHRLVLVQREVSREGRRCVEIPETEAKRAKLHTPAWVIVDEFNVDDLATSWALESTVPVGQFTRRFMAKIAAEAAAAIRAKNIRSIPRQ